MRICLASATMVLRVRRSLTYVLSLASMNRGTIYRRPSTLGGGSFSSSAYGEPPPISFVLRGVASGRGLNGGFYIGACRCLGQGGDNAGYHCKALPEKSDPLLDTVSTTCGSGWVNQQVQNSY